MSSLHQLQTGQPEIDTVQAEIQRAETLLPLSSGREHKVGRAVIQLISCFPIGLLQHEPQPCSVLPACFQR